MPCCPLERLCQVFTWHALTLQSHATSPCSIIHTYLFCVHNNAPVAVASGLCTVTNLLVGAAVTASGITGSRAQQ